MRINFVLIDAENVKPEFLEKLRAEHFRVILFVSAKHDRIRFDVANAMHSLGANGRYVKITNVGPNALDFHIAFYIGRLSLEHPGSYFHIITKDKGFDALIKHLREGKIFCSRWESVLDIPLVSVNGKVSSKQRAVDYYAKRISSSKTRPATVKTLHSSIHAHFLKLLSTEEVGEVVVALSTSRHIVVDGTKVSYPKKT